MKYIKKLILENFQSHKYTVVDFDNGLNVIVGPSDSGKTAILRGIRWALYNEPSGDYFIREGESEASITVIFSDGTKIKRYRSKSKNIYYLYDDYNNELKFEGFGTSVPEEILNATGIRKISLDKDITRSINISEQLEGAFLLSETGSVKANSIGYLVGVDIIDDTLKETLREERALSNMKRGIDQHIAKLEDDLSKYDYLDEVRNKSLRIEEILSKINNKEELVEKYRRLLDKYSNLNKELNILNEYLGKLKNLNRIELLLSKIDIKSFKYKQLEKNKQTLDKNTINIENNNNIIASLKDINLIEKNIRGINLLLTKENKLSQLNLNKNKIYLEIKKYDTLNKELRNLKRLHDIRNKIDNNIIQLKKLNDIQYRLRNINKSLVKGYAYINKIKNFDRIGDRPLEIEKKTKSLDLLINLLSKVKSNKVLRNELNKEINEHKNKTNLLSSQYKDLLMEKGSCPLCFSNIDECKAKHIISHYN